MEKKYDLVIIGSGPGGYVAAIRASQLGLSTAIVEKQELGGVCLNWGCIPTKALLKSAEVYRTILKAEDFGFFTDNVTVNFPNVIERSRKVAERMSKGVQYLLKKNKIDIFNGHGLLSGSNSILIQGEENKELIASQILLATGGRSRTIESIPYDGEVIIGYKEALVQSTLPKTMIVIGGGVIGCELAQVYASLGTEVTLLEMQKQIVSTEDVEVSRQLARTFKKQGMQILTEVMIERVSREGETGVVEICNKKGIKETFVAEKVLSAVGITPNTEEIGLEHVGVKTERGYVSVNENYQTNIQSIYAIGDIIATPALAHVASAEALYCVEHIAGEKPTPIDYHITPMCIYTSPEIASVGYTEAEATKQNHKVTVGKFPLTASGKAHAVGHSDGFVKLVFEEESHQILGATLMGYNVTEMLPSLIHSIKEKKTVEEIDTVMYPHPTISESILEATLASVGKAIHI